MVSAGDCNVGRAALIRFLFYLNAKVMCLIPDTALMPFDINLHLPLHTQERNGNTGRMTKAIVSDCHMPSQ